MPGMDGIELGRKLFSAGLAQRFLFISGYCDEDSLSERAGDLPATAFLSKPFSIPDLIKVFRGLLEEQPAAVRVGSVREKRAPSPLRHPAAPIDVMRALRRKTGRLQLRRDALLDDARWGLRTHALLLSQIQSQCAALETIQRSILARRARL